MRIRRSVNKFKAPVRRDVTLKAFTFLRKDLERSILVLRDKFFRPTDMYVQWQI